MSWSIEAQGTQAEVMASLRKQVHADDARSGHPEGLSYTENQIRRQAQTLLLDVVHAHDLTAEGNGPLSTHTQLKASAWGSESVDADGSTYQTLGVSVMVHAPQNES